MKIFEGSCVALVTPFTETNTVDYNMLTQLVRWHVKAGTQAIVVNGTTGEGSTLTSEEKETILTVALEAANGDVPIIAGTGGNNTVQVIQETLQAETLGAAGVMIVTPYYNKTSQRGLIEHYHAIAERTNIPIILYNVPSRTGMHIAVDTALKLAEHPRIVALKEASGDMSYTMELLSKVPENFAIYAGNDDLIVPIIAAGGDGVISVLANILPEATQHLCERSARGDYRTSRKNMQQLFPVIQALFCDVNPIGIKAAMNIVGMRVGKVRLPLVPLDNEAQQELALVLRLYKEAMQ